MSGYGGVDEGSTEYVEVAHRSPSIQSDAMPCCGLTPHQVPRGHRLTADDYEVTCGAALWGESRYWIGPSPIPGYALVHVTTSDGRRFSWQVVEG